MVGEPATPPLERYGWQWLGWHGLSTALLGATLGTWYSVTLLDKLHEWSWSRSPMLLVDRWLGTGEIWLPFFIGTVFTPLAWIATGRGDHLEPRIARTIALFAGALIVPGFIMLVALAPPLPLKAAPQARSAPPAVAPVKIAPAVPTPIAPYMPNEPDPREVGTPAAAIVDSVEPPVAKRGDVVVLRGRNFGTAANHVVHIGFGSIDITVTPLTWSPTSVSLKIPDDLRLADGYLHDLVIETREPRAFSYKQSIGIGLVQRPVLNAEEFARQRHAGH